MKLARLEAFIDEVRKDESLQVMVEKIEFYYSFASKWYSDAKVEITDSQKIDNFQLAQLIEHWRPRKSGVAYFSVSDLDAVVVATFPAPPKKPRRETFSLGLQRCVKHSADAFHATHNPLTQLYNKPKSREILIDAIKGHIGPTLPSTGDVREVQAIPSVSVLALDLDHFKQVNDTFGHHYGDLVLRCFALRMEQCAKSVEQTYPARVRVILAHPSGEEFNVFLVGALSDEDVLNIGEMFKEQLGAIPCPNDTEVTVLREDGNYSEVQIPHVNSRRVTASIGIASISVNPRLKAHDQAADVLLEQADIALYSAKAGGRNRVRRFPDILARYGRVLEHHTDMNVVVIDIGKKVNVKRGQEFLVFHPDFTGQTPYVFRDGRTERNLGLYPKLQCGRIVVFDVQTDVSFCEILDKHVQDFKFPSGSTLQAVPLGSIAHLLAQPVGISAGIDSSVNILSAAQLPKIIAEIAARKHDPFVAVFRVKDHAKVLEEKGAVFVNQSLAKLYSVIRQRFPAHASVGHIELTEYAVVLALAEQEDFTAVVQDVLEAAAIDCGRQIRFIAGICRPVSTKHEKYIAPPSNVNFSRALDLARYAVSDEGIAGDSNIELFSIETAIRVVSTWKERRDYSRALADYRRLSEIGIMDSQLENQAGICAVASGDFAFAQSILARAVQLNPAEPIYVANLALAEYKVTGPATAYETFKRSLAVNDSFTLPAQYKPAFAMATYYRYKEAPRDIDRQVVVDSLNEALREFKGTLLVEKHELTHALLELSG